MLNCFYSLVFKNEKRANKNSLIIIFLSNYSLTITDLRIEDR